MTSLTNTKSHVSPQADDIEDPNEATKGDTGHPEELDVTVEEMSFYASTVSDGDSVSSLKKIVDKKKDIKPLDSDNAYAVFQHDTLDQLGAQEGETIPSQPTQQDLAQEQSPSDMGSQSKSGSFPEGRQGFKSQEFQTQEQEEQMKAQDEAINTKKWAQAVFDDPQKRKAKKPANPTPELPTDVKKMSAAQYEMAFHQATLAANNEVKEKSFSELQEQDLQESESNDKQEKIEEANAKKENNPEPLNKEGSQINGENPESMGDIQMDQAMGYTDQASNQAVEYNSEQVKETEKKKTEETKNNDPEPLPDPKTSASKGSFYEQILAQSLETDPNAVKTLADLKVEMPKSGAAPVPQQSQQQTKEKNLAEQLWERNNPEAAKTLVVQTKEEKQRSDFQKLKESEEVQMDALLSISEA